MKPDAVFAGECVRCGAGFVAADRRAQYRGGDLCVTCHRDPTRRGLAITRRDGAWIPSCARTLARTVFRPGSCFQEVLEPVEHRRIILYLWTLRLPSWVVTLISTAWTTMRPSALPAPPGSMGWVQPTLAGSIMGDQFAQAMGVWLLLMVPLGVPVLYFFGGIVAHLCMSLTGPMTRSVGATMRAFGLAAAIPMLVSGFVDIGFALHMLTPEIWAWISAPGLAFAGLVLGIGLARSHDASLWRGFVVALVPLAFLAGGVLARDAFELTELPGNEVRVSHYRGAPMIPKIPR